MCAAETKVARVDTSHGTVCQLGGRVGKDGVPPLEKQGWVACWRYGIVSCTMTSRNRAADDANGYWITSKCFVQNTLYTNATPKMQSALAQLHGAVFVTQLVLGTISWAEVKRIWQWVFSFICLEIVFGYKVGIRVGRLRGTWMVIWEDEVSEDDDGEEEGDDEPDAICYAQVALAQSRKSL